jgi:hypothetical protein
MTMAKKNAALPKELFVYWEPDSGVDPFLMTYEEIEEAAENAGEKTLVGTYVLQHTAKYAVDKIINEL